MKKKVLIVDDEKLILDLAVMGLRSLGIEEIKSFQNGKAAYADYCIAIEGKPFDLIISDWQMPEMDGLEFLKKVRENDLKTPFVMLTAASRKEDVVAAVEAKVTDYISKPFQIEQFLKKVSKYLEEKSEDLS